MSGVMILPLFIRRYLGTSKSICQDKNFNYNICYENTGQKNSKILTSQKTDKDEQYASKQGYIK